MPYKVIYFDHEDRLVVDFLRHIFHAASSFKDKYLESEISELNPEALGFLKIPSLDDKLDWLAAFPHHLNAARKHIGSFNFSSSSGNRLWMDNLLTYEEVFSESQFYDEEADHAYAIGVRGNDFLHPFLMALLYMLGARNVRANVNDEHSDLDIYQPNLVAPNPDENSELKDFLNGYESWDFEFKKLSNDDLYTYLIKFNYSAGKVKDGELSTFIIEFCRQYAIDYSDIVIENEILSSASTARAKDKEGLCFILGQNNNGDKPVVIEALRDNYLYFKNSLIAAVCESLEVSNGRCLQLDCVKKVYFKNSIFFVQVDLPEILDEDAFVEELLNSHFNFAISDFYHSVGECEENINIVRL